MFSYEERIRAVKLYIKLGKRLGATIRQLGYPTKNSLIGWYREYERDRDLQVGYVRSTGKYSADQMQVAVQYYLDHDRCIASTMRALGYPCRELLTAWIDELHPQVRRRIVGHAPNVQHPQELKNAAVVELCTRTTSAQAIAQSLAEVSGAGGLQRICSYWAGVMTLVPKAPRLASMVVALCTIVLLAFFQEAYVGNVLACAAAPRSRSTNRQPPPTGAARQ